MSELSRLRWRCRRGMRELDFVFDRFLDKCYNDLTDQQKADFERLLEEEDDRLWAWLFQLEPVADEAYAPLIAHIRANAAP